jgi:DNA ligase-1
VTALADVAAASADVGSTSSRLAKAARLANLLGDTDPSDVAVVVSWLSGELPQRQIGVGWAARK